MPREQVVAVILDEAVLLAVVLAAGVLVAFAAGFKWYVLLPLAAVAGFALLLLVKGIEAQRRRPLTGVEALLGKKGVVIDVGERGELVVRVEGELWRALCRGGCRVGRGAVVRVVGFEGLTLLVEPVEPAPTR